MKDGSNGARFTREHRLTGEKNFKRFSQTELRSFGGHFLVLAVYNGLPNARLGLVVSKRNVRNSTNRNRIKRLARESFRHHQSQLSGLDVLIVACKGSETLNNKQIRLSLENHWHKLARCKDS